VAKPSLWGCPLYLFGLKKPKSLSDVSYPVHISLARLIPFHYGGESFSPEA